MTTQDLNVTLAKGETCLCIVTGDSPDASVLATAMKLASDTGRDVVLVERESAIPDDFVPWTRDDLKPKAWELQAPENDVLVLEPLVREGSFWEKHREPELRTHKVVCNGSKRRGQTKMRK